jgi:DNA-binding NarL/FixJ family response regulator
MNTAETPVPDLQHQTRVAVLLAARRLKMEQITVFIADRHNVFREALAGMLGSDTSFKVVGQSTDASHAIEGVSRLAPDVLILDLDIPGSTNGELISEVLRVSPKTRIVVLTTSADYERALFAMQNGARGFITKDTSLGQLLDAIVRVKKGELVIDATLQKAGEHSRFAAKIDALTPREKQVLALIAEGLSTKEVAARLWVTPKTVANHLSHAYQKLGVRNRAQAVAAVYNLQGR